MPGNLTAAGAAKGAKMEKAIKRIRVADIAEWAVENCAWDIEEALCEPEFLQAGVRDVRGECADAAIFCCIEEEEVAYYALIA